MSEVDLLDPRASDRFLRAYALLASEYAAGAKSAVDSLMPFVRRAIAVHNESQFDVRQISKYVEDTYRVRVPIYMMSAFKNRLIEEGYLEKTLVADVLVCKVVEKIPQKPVSATLSTEELAAFEAALTAFAETRTETGKPFASENWGEALIKFFAGWDEKKTATVARQLIYDSKRLDDRIVSNFIGSLDKKSEKYHVAKKLYYGVLVADFFTCITELSTGESLNNVDVILDTTLLMRLLGTSGELLREATAELVGDIQELGGGSYYFAHTYEETVESLEALAYRIGTRGDVNRESAHALAAGETSLTKIQLLVSEADTRLGELSITQHNVVYDKKDNRFQTDEEGFVRKIGGRQFEQHRVRWERDAQSLALVMRLRQGSKTRKLGDARAIFVTHNGSIARAAREFLEFSSFEVPPILTTDQVSVLAWLERGGGINDQELSSKLAAACYEAVIPREGWESEFWQRMEELQASDEYRGLLNSQVTHSMRATILDRTFGEPSLARQLELGPIVKELAEHAEADALRTRRAGYEEGLREAEEVRDRRALDRSDRFAILVANGVVAVFFGVLVVGFLVSAINSLINPDGRNYLFYVYGAFAMVLSLFAILALFEINPTIARLKLWLRNKVSSLIYEAIK